MRLVIENINMKTKIVRQEIGIASCHGIFKNNSEWGSPIKGRVKIKSSNPSNAETKVWSHN